MTTYTMKVSGMHCRSCKILVADTLEELGAHQIVIDLDEKKQVAKVICDFEGSIGVLKKAIEEPGYKVV